MKVIQPLKSKNLITGTLPPVPKGHTPHKTGSGKHDSRPNRLRTRQTQTKEALQNS